MTDAGADSGGVSTMGAAEAASPGALLRSARQAQGLHIAALAAALKVNQRKLELLENDQFSELPDVAFARALAQAVCRHLKIDAFPVLALLPAPAKEQPGLERVTNGLNTPFREHAQRYHHPEPGEWPLWMQPQLAVPLLLVLAALAFWFLPRSWVPEWFSGPLAGASAPAGQPAGSAPAADAAPPVAEPAAAASAATSQSDVPALPAAAQPPVAEALEAVGPAASSPSLLAEVSAAAAAAASAPLPPGTLVLRAAGESWIEVIDGRGDVLVSRLLGAGETLGLNGVSPLQLRVGNAEGMLVRYKGRTVPLRMARDNTARIELK